MSDLTRFRDHARTRAEWQPGESRAACKDRTAFGTPKPADHANCGGHNCGCECHRPSDREREMWRRLAAEVDDYLGATTTEDLFGEMTTEPTADTDRAGVADGGGEVLA